MGRIRGPPRTSVGGTRPIGQSRNGPHPERSVNAGPRVYLLVTAYLGDAYLGMAGAVGDEIDERHWRDAYVVVWFVKWTVYR